MRLDECTPGRRVRARYGLSAKLGEVVELDGPLVRVVFDGGKIKGYEPRDLFAVEQATPLHALRLDGEPLQITTACALGPVVRKFFRWRSEAYRTFVRSYPCSAHGSRCTAEELHPSHHRIKGQGATSRKDSDERTVSLCYEAHELYHRTYCIGGMSVRETREWVEMAIRSQLQAYRGEIPIEVKARYPEVFGPVDLEGELL